MGKETGRAEEKAAEREKPVCRMRLAEAKDVGELMDLYRAAMREEGCTWDEDYPTEELVRNDIARKALYCNENEQGELTGAFAVDEDEAVEKLPVWDPAITPVGEIARLVVRRDCQNRGLARQLLCFAMEELERKGYRGIHFLVSKTNERALRSYGRLDFHRAGETELFGHDWYCYEKSFL